MKLTPEQIADAEKMATGQDLPNFSKAGTGKTHTALEAIRMTGNKRNLVLAPRIALDWWQEQAQEYLGVDAQVFDKGSSPLVGEFVISTYDLVRNNIAKFYDWSDGGNLTMDESHNVCGVTAGRTQALFGKKADLVGGLVEKYDQVWPMTGTPKQNYANDMWTQVAVLHPEVFDPVGATNYEAFCRMFTYKKQKQFHPKMQPQWVVSGDQNQILLSRLVYGEVGAIRRMEAPNMPKLLERELHVPVKVDKDLAKKVKALEIEELIRQLSDPDSIVAKMRRIIGLAKVKEIVPYVGDCVKDSPILLGCWHRDVMTDYEDHFKKLGLKVAQVHGGTASSKLPQVRNDFNAGNIDVLIGQMKAMGVSWNLQEACHHVITAEVTPSPLIREQFYKRVFRRGQKRACLLDDIVGKTDLEMALVELRQRKEMSDELING